VGVFLVKIFGKERASERRNENIIVSGTLKIYNKTIEFFSLLETNWIEYNWISSIEPYPKIFKNFDDFLSLIAIKQSSFRSKRNELEKTRGKLSMQLKGLNLKYKTGLLLLESFIKSVLNLRTKSVRLIFFSDFRL